MERRQEDESPELRVRVQEQQAEAGYWPHGQHIPRAAFPYGPQVRVVAVSLPQGQMLPVQRTGIT